MTRTFDGSFTFDGGYTFDGGSPLPTLQYLVAFQNNPTDDPALIATVASPAGTLGGTNAWTDITQFVDSHQISRGRQHELQQFEAGTLQLHLNNQDARFNSWNTSSPYNGFLLPRKLVQVRATWAGTTYYRFTGHVDAWPVEWADPISGFAILHATDAFRLFNLADISSTGYEKQVLADGATHYWRLGDPVGSTVAIDSAGSDNGFYLNTLALGSPGALLAESATSTNFMPSGSTPTGWVSLATAGLPTTTSTFTLESWVFSPNWADGGGSVNEIFGNGTAKGSGVSFGVSTTGAVQLACVDDTGTGFLTQSNATLSTNTWHHVAVTRSGGTINMYIDGGAATFTTPISGTPGAQTPTTAALAAAAPPSGSSSAPTFPSFAGQLQEVAVYPSVLSAAQISNHHFLATFPQQGTGARVGRILDVVGWSSTARAIDTGVSTVQAVTSSLTQTSSLSHLQSVEATEAGALFMTGDGKVKFLSRQSLWTQAVYTSSQGTVGDNVAGGDMPLQPGPTLGIDDIDLFNEAIAQRSGGNTQTASNSTSIASYGRVTWRAPTTLLGTSDTEVLGLTQYIVAKYQTPVVRLQAITVDLLELISPNLVSHLLSLDLLYRLTVERTQPPGGGTAFSQAANIEHITETVTPDTWKVTFGLAIADQSYWIMGVSKLGQTTRLAF